MLEHRDTYGQAQVCSKGRQGSSVSAIFSLDQVLAYMESATSEYSTSLNVLVHWACQGESSLS